MSFQASSNDHSQELEGWRALRPQGELGVFIQGPGRLYTSIYTNPLRAIYRTRVLA